MQYSIPGIVWVMVTPFFFFLNQGTAVLIREEHALIPLSRSGHLDLEKDFGGGYLRYVSVVSGTKQLKSKTILGHSNRCIDLNEQDDSSNLRLHA